MSGHSKWANIRVKKTAEDAKRGKVFTRHARLIEMAAREGGGDPVSNASLRTAIDNAREDNVPKDNIERAIKKGTGALKGEAMQEIVYEAYGPGGTAFIIECLSDNRNRTAANVRSIIANRGGRLAESGSVGWMFERKGVVVGRESGIGNRTADVEALELELIDLGAEDIAVEGDIIRVVTGIADWGEIRDCLKGKGFTILSAGLSCIPRQTMDVTDEVTAQKVSDFIEAIEEDDDVSEVHTNATMPHFNDSTAQR